MESTVRDRKKNGVVTEEKLDELAEHQSGGVGTQKAIIILVIIFGVSVLSLFYVYTICPELEPDELTHIKLPRDIEDAKNLGSVLSRYKDKYYTEVLGSIFITYIFLQTFAIPGSIFLSILCGFLFSFYVALGLVCFCSAAGASLCYLLSSLVGRRLVDRFAKERALKWSATVNNHRDHLLNYIIFLRITPFLPNWFINIVSPLIGVSLGPFFFGTFLGVAPPSFVAIQAGTTLHQLTSSRDTVSWNSVAILALFAILSVLPVAFKHRLQKKFS